MSDERLDLAAIRARAEASTPGPWEDLGLGEVWSKATNELVVDVNEEDARFIAHARTDVPALLHTVEALGGVLREALVVIGNMHPMPLPSELQRAAEVYQSGGSVLNRLGLSEPSPDERPSVGG